MTRLRQGYGRAGRKDAALLARLARADETLLSPVQLATEQAQLDLLQIKMRDHLVRQRVDVISWVRCSLESLGIQLRGAGRRRRGLGCGSPARRAARHQRKSR